LSLAAGEFVRKPLASVRWQANLLKQLRDPATGVSA
jgi:hypothetical protein